MYLYKSIYVRVWNCPKYAWISRHHPEMIPVNEDTLARFRTGDEVGDLARGLFGPFVNVTAEKEEGNWIFRKCWNAPGRKWRREPR